MAFNRICVVGLGYVGLPTAAVIASRGIDVIGVDVNSSTVDTINAGQTHIVEPDLDMIVHGAVSKGWLSASLEPAHADAFIIAVPTPFDEDYRPDLTYLRAATDAIAPALNAGNLVVVESTVPVGTTNQVRDWLASARPDLAFPSGVQDSESYDVFVAHSPERVLPGHVLLELVRNDRVIDGVGKNCATMTAELYGMFVEGSLHLTDAKTAELVKLSENAYRDVNIAFANELANVAGPLGIDVRDVVELANYHPRVNILSPGPGVGGHCIAVDPWFIVVSAPDRTPLIQAARRLNDQRPSVIASSIEETPSVKNGAAIACLGLSYKADIDDLRESPAVEVVRQVRTRVSNDVYIVEPHISELPGILADNKNVHLRDLESAVRSSGCVVVLTDHREFTSLEADVLIDKDVIDTRGIWRSR